jgi:RNA polymerase sigma-70 factor (ECF subfamily)
VDPVNRSDSTTFDELVRAHYARLCDFAYRFVHSRAVAEDLVQDVFVRLWERHDQFDFQDPLKYLYQAVRNRAVSHLRHERIHARWEAEASTAEHAHEHTAATETDVEELQRAIAAAVDALPERCRVIFTMSREQDLSYAEIARILDLSVKTVETQMGRALKSLRTRLAPFLTAGLMVFGLGELAGRFWK